MRMPWGEESAIRAKMISVSCSFAFFSYFLKILKLNHLNSQSGFIFYIELSYIILKNKQDGRLLVYIMLLLWSSYFSIGCSRFFFYVQFIIYSLFPKYCSNWSVFNKYYCVFAIDECSYVQVFRLGCLQVLLKIGESDFGPRFFTTHNFFCSEFYPLLNQYASYDLSNIYFIN